MTSATATLTASLPSRNRLALVGFAGLIGLAAALQVSIAAAGICLGIVLTFWVLSLVVQHERVQVPGMFVPLVMYAALTLISSAFAIDARSSFIDDKQLILFLIVPAVYYLARGPRASLVLTVVITVGALSALIGIVQYGVLQYDSLGRRPEGLLTHYMTYSGLLVLVIGAAAARALFSTDRVWPVIVMPALVVALVLTLTRGAWVGACAAVAVLLARRDFRFMTVLPILAAVVIAIAPSQITERASSMFDLRDPTIRDRIEMLRIGGRMIGDHPLTGVGPNMVQRRYAEYRQNDQSPINPHLHNVPVQIAAERGLPALGVWLWFIVLLIVDLTGRLRRARESFLPAAALAATVGMLTAGLFEYNFGDSEFLMLFLVLITLPYAAEREPVA
ncbi:MAG TPA: O-antigen ligase family protein [Vicinamibacterales bacterium]|jgi:O-antigen ligase